MSVLERCPSYRESNKGSKERQGATLGVRFTEVSVLQRCPLRESRLYSMVQCIVHGLGVSVLPPLHNDSTVEACNQTPSGHNIMGP